MSKLDDDVIEEARGRSETLETTDLVEILERYRVDGGRGVARGTLREYATALDYDPDTVDGAVDDRLVDETEWAAGRVIYRLDDDRVSVYPPRWHDELADTTDLTEHVALLHSSVTSVEGDRREAVTEDGVPETVVVRVARALSGMSHDEAYGSLQDLRKKGKLEEHADQHPTSRVRVA